MSATRTPLLPRLAGGTLLFNLAVIVWGAYVRASGSGAGCGSHWPLCNGEIIPHTGLIATAIEFAHRVSSGVCLALAVAVAWVAVREQPAGSAARRAGLAVLGFTLTEALIGAGLVLLRYVDRDQSLGRAIWICLHLGNTFALLGALAMTTAWSRRAPRFQWGGTPQELLRRAGHGRLQVTALLSVVAVLLLGMTGALTALGDTLFHSPSLGAGLAQDLAPCSHFLLRLRIFHPLLALTTGVLIFYFAEQLGEVTPGRLPGRLRALVAGQLALGGLNLVLLAPVALQLAHLAVAECLWVVLVLAAARAFEVAGEVQPETPSLRPAYDPA